ncbi:MAG: ATP-binding protein [Zetaproteobacteria bacterium]|nr:ATP-binding protein [Zetaproteobacteria bacterium]
MSRLKNFSLQKINRLWKAERTHLVHLLILTVSVAMTVMSCLYDSFWFLIAAITIDILIVGIFVSLRRRNRKILRQINQISSKLRRESERILRADQAKSTFIANISHEIRTPMDGILSYTQILLNSHIDTKFKGYIRLIEQNGKALLKIMDDVLDYSKIEGGKLELTQDPHSIHQIMQEIYELFLPGSERKKIAFHIRMSQTIPASLIFDAVRLRQVITNLIGNAIKYTEHGEVKVEVDYTAETQKLSFTIHDTRSKVSRMYIQELFRSLIPHEIPSAEEHEASTLGLSISQKIVHRMGGKIVCQNRDQQGSTFMFQINAMADKLQKILPAQPDPPPSASIHYHDLKILVIESNPMSQEVSKLLLSKHKVQLDIVGSELEGLSAMKSKSYDGVFIDIKMTHDKEELIERIHQIHQRRQPRVFALIHSQDETTWQQSHTTGISDVIKVIYQDELTTALDELVHAA